MPKNAQFLEKCCKIAAAPAPEPPLASGGWGLRPQTSVLLFPLTDKDLPKSAFLALKLFHYVEKFNTK